MRFNRLGILAYAIPGRARARLRASLALRWSRAAQADRQLVGDLIALGGVVSQTARVDGLPETDPQRLAYEAGRRDLALELIALSGVTIEEINTMMMEAYHDD